MPQSNVSSLGDLEYEGETLPRSKALATLFAFLCPGLAYWYIGKFIKGVTINLGFVLLLELFVILMGWRKFFPLWPLLVLAAGWLVFSALVALDVREEIATMDQRKGYLLKPFNNFFAYLFLGVLTFYLPILVSLELTEENMITTMTVEESSMYPGVLPGDVILIDRHGFDKRGVSLGDLIVVAAEAPDAPRHLLRVVAVQGDIVRVEGDQLYIDESPLERSAATLTPFGEAASPDEVATFVEENRGHLYPIAISRNTLSNNSISPMRLDDHQMFLMGDNRSQAPLFAGEDEGAHMRDSRQFGPIDVARVQGSPLYVLWSRSPVDGATRWSRVGLRLQ